MHFFWIKNISLKGVPTNISDWTSPLMCPKNPLIKKSDMYYKKQTDSPHLIYLSKRNVSLFPSYKGSITVEAAIVLPLFLFFCIQIISIISLFQLHSALQAALHQETSRLALQAYGLDMIGMDMDTSSVHFAEDIYLRSRVIERAGKGYLDRSLIAGGSSGIHISYSEKEEGQETIDVILSYQVEPFIKLLGFPGFIIKNRCRMKAWTGYALKETGLSDETEEELVYITETGTVYHKSRNCTHLALSVHAVETKCVETLRNEDGAKYYPCERCGENAGSTVFLTNQGNRYHTNLGCNGLKRTVYTVPISQAGGRAACSRCSVMG